MKSDPRRTRRTSPIEAERDRLRCASCVTIPKDLYPFLSEQWRTHLATYGSRKQRHSLVRRRSSSRLRAVAQ